MALYNGLSKKASLQSSPGKNIEILSSFMNYRIDFSKVLYHILLYSFFSITVIISERFEHYSVNK